MSSICPLSTERVAVSGCAFSSSVWLFFMSFTECVREWSSLLAANAVLPLLTLLMLTLGYMYAFIRPSTFPR